MTKMEVHCPFCQGYREGSHTFKVTLEPVNGTNVLVHLTCTVCEYSQSFFTTVPAGSRWGNALGIEE